MITNFDDFLLEGKQATYGCLMLELAASFSDEEKFGEGANWRKFAPDIDQEDLFFDENNPNPSGYGFEDDPHVTIKYGLHADVKPEEVLEKAMSVLREPVTISLVGLTLFENEKFDVLKYDVESEQLRSANAAVSELPNTDKFPDYHPHVTVAYLKPGTGQKYVKEMEPVELVSAELVYSDADKNKTRESISTVEGVE